MARRQYASVGCGVCGVYAGVLYSCTPVRVSNPCCSVPVYVHVVSSVLDMEIITRRGILQSESGGHANTSPRGRHLRHKLRSEEEEEKAYEDPSKKKGT